MVFEPGVTTRHLNPVTDHPDRAPHGAGLSLYHIKNAAIDAEVLSASSPTAIRATFDTTTLPERSLQSASRPPRSNLLAILHNFSTNDANLYYASPSRILATLLETRIIPQPEGPRGLWEVAARLGLEVSLRTAQRVWGGEIAPVAPVGGGLEGRGVGRRKARMVRGGAPEGPVLDLGEEERGGIADILRRAARASYLEVGELELRTRPGEVSVRARIYEPEEEYE